MLSSLAFSEHKKTNRLPFCNKNLLGNTHIVKLATFMMNRLATHMMKTELMHKRLSSTYTPQPQTDNYCGPYHPSDRPHSLKQTLTVVPITRQTDNLSSTPENLQHKLHYPTLEQLTGSVYQIWLHLTGFTHRAWITSCVLDYFLV